MKLTESRSGKSHKDRTEKQSGGVRNVVQKEEREKRGGRGLGRVEDGEAVATLDMLRSVREINSLRATEWSGLRRQTGAVRARTEWERSGDRMELLRATNGSAGLATTSASHGLNP